jgi:hypothetical protein
MRRYNFRVIGGEVFATFEAILPSDEDARAYAKSVAAKFSRSKSEVEAKAVLVWNDSAELLFKVPILHLVSD